MKTSVSVFASYHRVFPILSDFLYVVQRVKQEVISPLEPVDGQGMVFIHTVPTHFTSTACQNIISENHLHTGQVQKDTPLQDFGGLLQRDVHAEIV